MDRCINTVATDLLNDSSWLYVGYHLQLSQGLLFEWNKMGMKIEHDLYLQCIGGNHRYQTGYHGIYNNICDLLKDLSLASIEKDNEVLQDHEFWNNFCTWMNKRYNIVFKYSYGWDFFIIEHFHKKIPGRNGNREETIHVSIWFTYYITKSSTNVSTKHFSAVWR